MDSDNLSRIESGVSHRPQVPVDKSVDKLFTENVVITPYYPHNGDMSGEEVKMNKSHRVAMAQALLAELSEATARYGAGNKGVKRLHRMVRGMVAELLA